MSAGRRPARVGQLVAARATRCSGSASSPSSSPAAAASTRPSPLPATRTDVVAWPGRPAPGRRPAPARPGRPAAPTAASDSDCSSTIGTSGRLTTGVAVRRPARRARRSARPANSVVRRAPGGACGSGRRRRRRPPRSCRRRAAGRPGRSAPARPTPAWKRSSRAYSRSIAAGAAERQQVAGDERPVGQPGQRRIDGVAPAEGAELGARQLQHAVAGRQRVERGGGVGPRRRRLLVAVEGRVDEAVAGERRAGWRAPASTTTPASGRTARPAPADARRPSASTSAAAAERRARASSSGSARVLERRASAAPDVAVAERAGPSSGDGSSIGWTPTPSTTPVDDEGDGEAAVRPAA